MTQVSGQWDGELTGDAAIAPYGQNDVGVHKGAGVLYDRAVQGVLFRNDEIRVKLTNDTYVTCDLTNLFEVTNPAGLTVRVTTGGAIVDGMEVYNTANVDFSTTDDTTAIEAPGSGANFYRVVLRKDWSAQTVRLAVLDANVVAPDAVTQVDGTTWEISLATVEITSGSVVTVTDTRRYVPEIQTEMVADDAITTAKIDDEAVTAAKIDNRVRKFQVNALIGTDDSTGVFYLEGTGGTSASPRLHLNQSATIKRGIGSFYIPSDYVSDMTATAIVVTNGNGDVYVRNRYQAGTDEDSFRLHAEDTGWAAVTLVAGAAFELNFITSLDLTLIASDDRVQLMLERGGTDPGDDAIELHLLGWVIQYIADS